MGSVTDRRVLTQVRRWADEYQRGTLPGRPGLPDLSPGERVAVRVFPVRVSVEDADRPFEQWTARPGSRSLRPPFANDGSVCATSQRLFTFGRPRRGVYQVGHEWRWDAVLSVEVVPNWRGVMLRLREDTGRLWVVANVFHTFLVRPGPVTLAAVWLKVVGAWADSRSELDRFLRVTEQRLG